MTAKEPRTTHKHISGRLQGQKTPESYSQSLLWPKRTPSKTKKKNNSVKIKIAKSQTTPGRWSGV